MPNLEFQSTNSQFFLSHFNSSCTAGKNLFIKVSRVFILGNHNLLITSCVDKMVKGGRRNLIFISFGA